MLPFDRGACRGLILKRGVETLVAGHEGLIACLKQLGCTQGVRDVAVRHAACVRKASRCLLQKTT